MTECPGCGRRYEHPLRFCSSCGTQLTDDQVDQAAETVTPPDSRASPDAPTTQLPDDSSVTQRLPAGRLWSPGEPLAEPHQATVRIPPVSQPHNPYPPPPRNAPACTPPPPYPGPAALAGNTAQAATSTTASTATPLKEYRLFMWLPRER